jgi:hypothetical protein
VSSIALAATGCETGEDGIVDNDDRITCMAEIAITGMHIEGDNGPEACQSPGVPPGCEEGGLGGCRPMGAWRFTTSVTSNDCPATEHLLPMYEFTVQADMTQADPYYYWIYTIVTPADDPEAEVKVTSGGGGLCEADLQLFPTADGKTTILLHPAIESDMGDPPDSTGRLLGEGTYEIHTTNQIPETGP